MPNLEDPAEREEWIKRAAAELPETIDSLVKFSRAVHKLKLGASGGRVTLNTDECRALIWGLKMLKDRSE